MKKISNKIELYEKNINANLHNQKRVSNPCQVLSFVNCYLRIELVSDFLIMF